MSKWPTLAILTALIAPVAALGSPELRFDQNAITVHNVTARAQVLLCALTREPRSGMPVQMRRIVMRKHFFLKTRTATGWFATT